MDCDLKYNTGKILKSSVYVGRMGGFCAELIFVLYTMQIGYGSTLYGPPSNCYYFEKDTLVENIIFKDSHQILL